MAMMLYSHEGMWDRLREMAATAIPDTYMKAGWLVGTDAAEDVATNTVLVATAHAVAAKDFVMFYTGDEESEPRHAESVTTDFITLGSALSGTPSAGEEFVYMTGSVDAAEASCTTTNIKATAHAVSAGDMVWFVDGGEVGEPRIVASVNANDFTLDTALSGAPSAAEEFAFATPDSTGAVESGTTDTIITDADHAASVGDIFCMTSGDELAEFRVVISATATTFTLNEALSGTPTAAETYALITPDGTDAIEAGESTSRLALTAHSAAVGDSIVMTSGDEDGEVVVVTAVGTDYVDFSPALSGTPSAAETLSIVRPVAVGANGAKVLHIKSSLNQGVYISFDGTNDHIYVEGGDDIQVDLKANNLQLGDKQLASTYIYVKADSTPPSTGKLYIASVA